MRIGPWRIHRGQVSEQQSLDFLRRQGLRPVTRNYRCAAGEIDLIMLDASCLVFVEIRFRTPGRYGDGLASVNRAKQKRLCRAARHFLARHPEYGSHPSRFDVVAVREQQGKPEFNWVRGAFYAEGH